MRAIRYESGPTKIMCRANISWRLLNEFIPGLLLRGLIVESTAIGRKSYFLTPKGNQTLKILDLVRLELTEPTDPKSWTYDSDEPSIALREPLNSRQFASLVAEFSSEPGEPSEPTEFRG